MNEIEKQSEICDSCGVVLILETDIESRFCTRCLKHKDNDQYFLSLLLKQSEKHLIDGWYYDDADATFKKCREEMLEMPYWKEQEKIGRKIISLEEFLYKFNSPKEFRLPSFD